MKVILISLCQSFGAGSELFGLHHDILSNLGAFNFELFSEKFTNISCPYSLLHVFLLFSSRTSKNKATCTKQIRTALLLYKRYAKKQLRKCGLVIWIHNLKAQLEYIWIFPQNLSKGSELSSDVQAPFNLADYLNQLIFLFVLQPFKFFP